MPKLAVTHIPQTVRLATTRPAGDAASDRLVETRLIHAPNRVVADVGAPPTEFAPQMLLVGDLVGGARFLLPAGRQTVRFRAPNGEVREWSGVLTYRSTSNLVRILNFLGITPGSPIDEARGKLREGLRQGWDQADLDDARLLLSVISAGPYVDPDRPAEVPPLESLARFAIETPMDWSALRAISGPTTTSTASTPPAHISTPQPSTLTIAGMPPGGATYVDGVRTNDVASIPLSRIANGELFWVVPASPGTHTLRVVPPEGEAHARTRTVDVPQHGTTMFRYSEMAQAAPATTGTGIRRNVPSTLRVIGMPEGGAVFLNGTRADDALSRWSDSGPRGWIVPAMAGSATVRVVPLTGAARSATVTIPSSGEATVTFSEMTPEAAARPTLRVIGMPEGGAVFLNGTRADDALSRWSDSGPRGWIVPAMAGSATVRVVPLTGAARSATVTIPSSGEATVTFSEMTPEAAARPTLRVIGMPEGGAVFLNGTRADDALSRWSDSGPRGWIVPAMAGSATVRVVPLTGAARSATVTIPSSGEATVTFSEMTPEAAARPTLRVIGMPEGGAVFLNGTRADDALSRWSDSGPRGWIVPAMAGSATVRVVPLTGAARSATVTIPSSGEATVTFSEMTPEAAARPTILVVTGMPSGGTISVNGTALDMSTGMWGDSGAWAMPAQPGQSSVTITPPVSSGALARRTDVMITPSATTTIAFSTMSVVPGTGPAAEPEKHDETQPPAHGNETPAHGTDEPQKRDETPPPVDHSHDEEAKRHADADHPAEHPLDTVADGTVVSTGRVVVRTTLPNVAGMVQRVDGSDVAHGAMAHSPDGTLTASVPPGSYQLVVWQEAGFPSIARTNVRTAPANVIVGADSVFSYTGAALTALAASMTNGSHADVVTQRLRDLFAAGGTVDLALLHFTELSR